MLFNSLQFVAFFPIVTLGYFLLSQRLRWAWLLAASCLFYMAFIPYYILILGFTIVVDYFAGIAIENARPERKRPYLIVSLLANIGILAVFKYANFFIENVNFVLASTLAAPSPAAIPYLRIALPIGLSFHTFQAMAYTIEVYRGNQKAERHFGLYALYVMFYPQLVAGPIERPQNVLPQLQNLRGFEYENVVGGLKLMAWGFFQKVVIADRLALVANPVFDHPQQFHGLLLAIGAVAFTLQIYLDFAGYSNIAIGAAQVMNVKLMTNFRQPFHAQSISEFWSRWHISLSTWFRDYLYIPLGGNRVSVPRWYVNLMLVFLVSGFWHGASWNFVIWGALHGFYLVTALIVAPYLPAVLKDGSRGWVRVLNIAWVFVLVCAAFVFFRAATFGGAVYILRHVPTGLAGDLRQLVLRHDVRSFIVGHGFPRPKEWAIALGGLVVAELVHRLQRDGSARAKLGSAPAWVRWPAYAGLVYSVVLLSNSGGAQFIYFQF